MTTTFLRCNDAGSLRNDPEQGGEELRPGRGVRRFDEDPKRGLTSDPGGNSPPTLHLLRLYHTALLVYLDRPDFMDRNFTRDSLALAGLKMKNRSKQQEDNDAATGVTAGCNRELQSDSWQNYFQVHRLKLTRQTVDPNGTSGILQTLFTES
ncbi:hypothetical protein KM043_016422 [Ampulex compressa]|nr:hypothetical protein KM043_016422 [Ampulex compressa]